MKTLGYILDAAGMIAVFAFSVMISCYSTETFVFMAGVGAGAFMMCLGSDLRS